MMLQPVDGKVRLSVRDLVEFIMRSGDIDNRISTNARNDAMLRGSEVHREIQGSREAGYRAEVPLIRTDRVGGFEVTVEGRADGIYTENGIPVIEEIKGVYRNVRAMRKPALVHAAQAFCYARIYSAMMKCPSVGVLMTYVDLESRAEKYFKYRVDAAALGSWYQKTLEKLLPWLTFLEKDRKERTASIQNLAFPFDYRPGQEQIREAVDCAIREKRRIYLQAPTGTGKTMAVLYPAVLAVGRGDAGRIFYLTAKNTTARAAAEALAVLRGKSLHLRSVIITAQAKICPHFHGEEGSRPACNPVACPLAKGHYDRVNAAILDAITHEQDLSRETIVRYAEKHSVCPFEFGLDLADFADAVLCDYNYAFDPTAKLCRFFTGPAKVDTIFLIDEAHNLPERARDMYSADLTASEISPIHAILKDRQERISEKEKLSREEKDEKNALDAILPALFSLRTAILAVTPEKTGEPLILTGTGDAGVRADTLSSLLRSYLDEHREFPGREKILLYSFRLFSFCDTAGYLDSGYRIYAEKTADGDTRLVLFCVNPGERLDECLEQAVSSVFFSGTFLPLPYYRDLTGGGEAMELAVPSPFPKENRRILIAQDVTSTYRRRGVDEYRKFARYIRIMAGARSGNYMVFFPSYRFMESVLAEMPDPDPDFDIVVQSPGMREQERNDFLGIFRETGERTIVGFCVLGGIFSESINLTGDRLIGTCIIGTGLTAPTVEQTILRQYYEDNGKNGFLNVQTIPGMTRVTQAAGRVIRTDHDRGVILLLDSRFLYRNIQSLFPEEWRDAKAVTLGTVEREIRGFWDSFQ